MFNSMFRYLSTNFRSMFYSKTSFTVFFLLLTQLVANAQEKDEREWRVKTKEVPNAALYWFKDAYEITKRTKWYGEKNETGNFFEAKLNRDGHRHSVKFTDEGIVIDVEIEFSLDNLPTDVQKNIRAALDSISPIHRVLKLQEQWTGTPDKLKDLISRNKRENLEKRFELEAFFSSGEKAGYYELMFLKSGEFDSIRPIKPNTSDHLQY